MIREFSAGGVVLRRMAGRWWFAVMEPVQRERVHDPTVPPVLCLPKGNVDAGETPEQAARREILEETGVEAELIEKIADSRYKYTRHWGDGKAVSKLVSFYLFRYRGGHIGEIRADMLHEVRSACWIPMDEADRYLAYGGEKLIVRRAHALIESGSAKEIAEDAIAVGTISESEIEIEITENEITDSALTDNEITENGIAEE